MVSFRNIFLSGHSAGAQLCGMVLASKWFQNLPKDKKYIFSGVFFQAGIFDLRPLISTSVNEPLNLDNESAVENSPMCKIQDIVRDFDTGILRKYLTLHIVVGEFDSPAFVEQAKEFKQKVIYFKNYDIRRS